MTDEPDKTLADIEATDGFAAAAWEAFARWVHAHRKAHPDDDRSEYDLVDVYTRECMGEVP